MKRVLMAVLACIAVFGAIALFRQVAGRFLVQMAFALASRPGATQADGVEAVGLAKIACARTAWKDAETLDTLAAAAARAGDFANAVTWEQQALAHNIIPEAKKAYEARLSLFRARQAFTDTAPTPIPLGPWKGI